MTLVHGGNIYEIASRLGCPPEDLLDYSASINPLGPPAGLLTEFNTYFHRLQHYPDISNQALMEALAGFHGLSQKRIVVGNGSTELIYWLPKVLGISKAVVVLPTFSEYGKAFDLQGIRMHKLMAPSENDFQPTVEQLEAVCREASPEAILFTHPGSPSGTLLPKEARSWLVEKCRRDGIFCLVDEVFIDFCEEESLKDMLDSVPNLVLIRSMTKFYGIPGLRLGYLLTSEALAARMKAFLPPWSVNTLAQIAGAHCIEQLAYRHKTLELVETERERMAEELEALQGCRVFPGRANYLLVEMDASLPSADILQKELLASDCILIRDCRSFEGLTDHHVRLAVRLPEQNRRLLDGITRWVRSCFSA